MLDLPSPLTLSFLLLFGLPFQKILGEWDMSLLTTKGEIWSTAVSQIIFSLSLTAGVMTAYGSNCPRSEPALLNSTVIAVANSTFSFLAGFAVFGSLGHLAFLEDTEVKEIGLRKGFGLVFGTWPVILNSLPGGIHWVRLLWFNLFMLGIDSAFSGVEGILIVLRDTALFRGVTNWKLAGGLCFSCFLLSLPMCTDAGFKLLDTIDFYANFMFLLIGFLETFAAGWINGLEDQIKSVGWLPNITFCFANFGSIILACGLWFGLGNIWAGFVGWILFYGLFTGLSVFFVHQRFQQGDGRSLKSGLYDLFLKNVMDFKTELESVIGWVPSIWAVGLRFVIPQILLILFVNLARAKNAAGESKFGHYSGEFLFCSLLGKYVRSFSKVPKVSRVFFRLPLFHSTRICCIAISVDWNSSRSVYHASFPSGRIRAPVLRLLHPARERH